MDIGTLEVRRLMLGLVTMWILLVLMSWYRDGSYILVLVRPTQSDPEIIADCCQAMAQINLNLKSKLSDLA